MDIQSETFDCAVVGAGPAGLSAALYMGRMRRSVIVIDDNEGRSNWHQINRNYLGFPDGIHARALRDVGRDQVSRYNVQFLSECVKDARVEGEGRERRFYLKAGKTVVTARTVIVATGVSDSFPIFDGSDDCIGKSIFWCIICDGYEAIGKKIVVLGSGDRAASLALQLLVFTDRVAMVPWKRDLHVEPQRLANLRTHGVEIHDSWVDSYECGVHGQLAALKLKDGTKVDLDSLFVTQWIEPNTQLAEKLGINVDDKGFIVTDVEQVTNIDGAYAAGDATRLFNHQISSAVHEGGMAAAAANYYLYEEWQKE